MGFSCFQIQRLSVRGHDRKLAGYQNTGIDHRMTMTIEPGSGGYADPSNYDPGLTLRIRKQ